MIVESWTDDLGGATHSSRFKVVSVGIPPSPIEIRGDETTEREKLAGKISI